MTGDRDDHVRASRPTPGATLEVGDLTIDSVTRRRRARSPVARRRRQAARSRRCRASDETDRRSTSRTTGTNHESFTGASANGYTLDLAVLLRQPVPVSLAARRRHDVLARRSTASRRARRRCIPTTIPAEAPRVSDRVGDRRSTRSSTSARRPRARSVSMWHLPGEQTNATTGGAHLVAAFDWFEKTLGPYRFGNHVGTRLGRVAARRVRRHGAPSVLARRVERDRRRGDERPRGGARLVRRRHPPRSAGRTSCCPKARSAISRRARSMSSRRPSAPTVWHGLRERARRRCRRRDRCGRSRAARSTSSRTTCSRARRTCAARSSTRGRRQGRRRQARPGARRVLPGARRRRGDDAGHARHDPDRSPATTRRRARRRGCDRRTVPTPGPCP